VNLTRRLAWFLFMMALAAPLGAGQDPMASWMEGQPVSPACLRQLEQADLAFLSGESSGNVPTTVSSRFLGGLDAGNGDALAVGLRLVPLLKGDAAQAVLKGLGEAMANHPQLFLRALQEFLDFSRKNGQAAALKETLWDAFVGADFGYAQDLNAQARDLRRRKALLENLADPSFQEAKGFTLQMLREKIREMPSGS